VTNQDKFSYLKGTFLNVGVGTWNEKKKWKEERICISKPLRTAQLKAGESRNGLQDYCYLPEPIVKNKK